MNGRDDPMDEPTDGRRIVRYTVYDVPGAPGCSVFARGGKIHIETPINSCAAISRGGADELIAAIRAAQRDLAKASASRRGPADAG